MNKTYPDRSHVGLVIQIGRPGTSNATVTMSLVGGMSEEFQCIAHHLLAAIVTPVVVMGSRVGGRFVGLTMPYVRDSRSVVVEWTTEGQAQAFRAAIFETERATMARLWTLLGAL